MKKINFLTVLMAIAIIFSSCKNQNNEQPDPTPEELGYAFDIWIPVVGATGDTGMGQDPHIVVKATQLDEGEINIEGKGAPTGHTSLTPNVVVKDGYYYNVSRDGNFGKFSIDAKSVSVIKEIPMPQILDRRFAHAWIADHILVLVSSTGKKQDVNWAKVDVNQMRIISEGKLALPAPEENEEFNSSGVLGFRKLDNKLLYSFVYTPKSSKGKLLTPRRNKYYMAFIDANTMKVENIDEDDRADMMTSTSFGETRQDKAFFDKSGNYFLSCSTILTEEASSETSTTVQRSHIFRVNAGENEIDKSYNGYTQERGKIISMTELRDGEVLLYMQDPKFANPENPEWNSRTNPYVFYWVVANLKNQTIKHLKDIPFSNGNFAQLASVVGNTVYIGTNTADDISRIYEYHIPTGTVKPGATLQKGFQFDRLLSVKTK